jgi:hypothetical protein
MAHDARLKIAGGVQHTRELAFLDDRRQPLDGSAVGVEGQCIAAIAEHAHARHWGRACRVDAMPDGKLLQQLHARRCHCVDASVKRRVGARCTRRHPRADKRNLQALLRQAQRRRHAGDAGTDDRNIDVC